MLSSKRIYGLVQLTLVPAAALFLIVPARAANPVPLLTSVSPASAKAGGGAFSLTVYGSHFIPGQSSITWNGQALPDATNCTAATPGSAAKCVATIRVDKIAQAGTSTIAVLNPGTQPSNRLFLSITDATTAITPRRVDLPAGNYPGDLVPADFNNDGAIDFLYTAFCDSSTTHACLNVLVGNGRGGFTRASSTQVGINGYKPVVADFNRDGKADISLASEGLVAVYFGNGSGGFSSSIRISASAGAHTIAVAAGDLNRDGNIDLFTCSNRNQTITVLLGNGSGGFTKLPESTVINGEHSSLRLADFNNDGFLDAAMLDIEGFDQVRLMLGDGTGKFTPGNIHHTGRSPHGFTVADFNGDGKPDIAVDSTFFDKTVDIFLGDGAGGMTTSPPLRIPNDVSAFEIAAGDMNGDGNVDLVLGTLTTTGFVAVYQGDGNGNFAAAGSFPVPGTYPIGIAVADLNGDGRPDIISGNEAANNTLGLLIQAAMPTISPTSITFPATAVGSGSAPQTVTLSNQGSVPLQVSGFSPSEMAFAYAGGTCPFQVVFALAMGQSCTVNLVFAPVSPSAGSGQLIFSLRDSTFGDSTVFTILSGTAFGAPSRLTIAGGNSQATPTGHLFAAPLQVSVDDGFGHRVIGANVTFTVIPGNSGAGASFSGSATAAVLTDSNGVATAPALTANGSTGAFTVTAAAGILNATFSLTNTPFLYTLGTAALSVDGAAGTGAVLLGVTTPSGPWIASTATPWLKLASGSQSGNGSASVRFTYDANPDAAPRTGTITIAGQTVTVTQAPAELASGFSSNRITSGVGDLSGSAPDKDGNVFTLFPAAGNLYRWSAAEGLIAWATDFNSPQGIAVDASGNVYIADKGNNAIKKWNASTSQVTTLVAGLNQPNDVVLDPSGNLYIADTGNNAVKFWSTSGTLTTLFSIAHPIRLAVPAASQVYVINGTDNAIYAWNPYTKTTSTALAVAQPQDMVVDGSGNIYFTQTGNTAISKWDAVNGSTVRYETGIGSGIPLALSLDTQGNLYWCNGSVGTLNRIEAAYVGPQAVREGYPAGVDQLRVFPPNVSFTASSDQSWLAITGTSGGFLTFTFSRIRVRVAGRLASAYWACKSRSPRPDPRLPWTLQEEISRV